MQTFNLTWIFGAADVAQASRAKVGDLIRFGYIERLGGIKAVDEHDCNDQ